MSCTAMAFFPANFMIQTTAAAAHEDENHHHHHHHHHHHQPPTSLSTPILSQDFHGGGGGGVASVLGKRSMSFSGVDVCDQGGEDDLSDDGSQVGEKKRRLNMEQVKTLEKNFELGNKLEPERKMQLARALGLQPRQIAIWFQNRRARWKTKQLEKDYEVLKRQFEAIKSENDALQAHNQKLHAEIMALKNREPTESINLNKETEGSCSNRSENSSDIKLDISRTPAIDSHPTSRTFFPSSNNTTTNNNNNSILRPTTAGAAHQLFQTSSRTHHHHHHHDLQCQTTKMQQQQQQDHNVKEESLCNMFCTIDDQTGFWPWLEQQHFN